MGEQFLGAGVGVPLLSDVREQDDDEADGAKSIESWKIIRRSDRILKRVVCSLRSQLTTVFKAL